MTDDALQKLWDSHNRPVPPASVAKAKLARYAIACRSTAGEWDNSDPVIIKARRKHDAGTHVMCQGHSGSWFVLYLVPHKRPVRRVRYFED